MFQVETIQGYLEEMGYTCTQYAFTDVNDLSAVTQSACDGSDVIYIPTDNTAANNTETIANVVIPAGVPVVCGESGICSGCGVATLSISYEELGRITGEMAVQILTGEVLLDKVVRNFALKLLSAVIGAIIYYVVITVVLRLGLESTDLKLLTALVVAVFLAVPYWKGRYFTKPVRKEGAPHA